MQAPPSSRPARHGAALAVAAVLVGWSTLAVGGVYAWASPPIVGLAVVLGALTRPRVARRPDTRPLDLALLGGAALVCVQALPLPHAVRWFLSPRVDVDRLELLLMPDSATTWRPLSIDPGATLLAAALIASAAIVYWSCRHLAGRGYAPALAAAVALVGLVAAVAAVLQGTLDPTRIYGLWVPQDGGARPFGPFVNRNHFATWLVMAAPLTAGAIVTTLRSRRSAASLADDALRTLESRDGWTVVAFLMMALTLILSMSRAALLAGTVAALTWAALAYSRSTRRSLALGTAVGAMLLVAAALLVSPRPILARIQETLTLGAAERTDIWRDAGAVSRAYPLTGTGLGTFERAMLVYQSTDRRTRTNQAHSQYLQVLAEGGWLLAVPAALACALFAWLAARRLAEDGSPYVWLRIGGVAGIAGVAVQSVWETGLRMPANSILLAVLAGIVTHTASHQRSRPREPSRGGASGMRHPPPLN